MNTVTPLEGQPLNKEERTGRRALFIPARFFIGLGTGWALGSVVPGAFIGLSFGSAAFAI